MVWVSILNSKYILRYLNCQLIIRYLIETSGSISILQKRFGCFWCFWILPTFDNEQLSRFEGLDTRPTLWFFQAQFLSARQDKRIRQIVLPTLNSEFKNFVSEFSLWFFSQMANWEKYCLGPIRSLFSFSSAQTEKKSWKKFLKQIGENVLWIHDQSIILFTRYND